MTITMIVVTDKSKTTDFRGKQIDRVIVDLKQIGCKFIQDQLKIATWGLWRTTCKFLHSMGRRTFTKRKRKLGKARVNRVHGEEFSSFWVLLLSSQGVRTPR